MAKLGLRIATNHIHVVNERHPSVLLLLTAEELDRLCEHGLMQEARVCPWHQVVPVERYTVTLTVFLEILFTENGV